MKAQLLTLAALGSAFFSSTLFARPEGPPPPPDPEAVVVEMFTDYDADENNSLNQEELIAAFVGIREKHMAARQGDRPRMGRKGPEGEESTDRPRKGKRRGPPAPEELAPKLIEDFDASGDGELNTEELLQALQKMHERGGRRGPGKPEADDAA